MPISLLRFATANTPKRSVSVAPANMNGPVEFFFASDPSAVVEHTKHVIYLEDGDICHVRPDGISIVRHTKQDGFSSTRAIQTLEMALAEIMKGIDIFCFSVPSCPRP